MDGNNKNFSLRSKIFFSHSGSNPWGSWWWSWWWCSAVVMATDWACQGVVPWWQGDGEERREHKRQACHLRRSAGLIIMYVSLTEAVHWMRRICECASEDFWVQATSRTFVLKIAVSRIQSKNIQPEVGAAVTGNGKMSEERFDQWFNNKMSYVGHILLFILFWL